MAQTAEDLEVMIDEYLDGRLEGHRREQFEARLRVDGEFRKKVDTATQSIEMLRKTLAKVEPGEDFEEKVTGQIISITQSNQSLRPAAPGRYTKLTAKDPDAKLIHDPGATAESRRLMLLAGIAAVVFALAVATIALVFVRSQSEPPKPPAAPSKK